MESFLRLTVVQRYLAALGIMALAVTAVVLVTMRTPYLGIDLSVVAGKVVVSTHPEGPAAGIPSGDVLVSMAAGGNEQQIHPTDLIEEPDALDSYDSFNGFVARQGQYDSMLRSGEVVLTTEDAAGVRSQTRVVPEEWRPIGDLPFSFWFQIACGVIIVAIAAWISVLRPGDSKVSRFANAGYGATLAMFTAAIYSSRELAIPEVLFGVLSFLNHTGSTVFAIFMIGLFTIYPKDLGLGWLFRVAVVGLLAGLGLNALQILPNISLGFYLGVALAMLTIIVLIGLQYRATRDDIPSRRALTWLGMSVIVGGGAFTVLMAAPILAGREAVLSQAYSFGFFPIIYLGVALGLVRYRLFDLDRWAFDVLSYVFAVMLFIAIDFLLVAALAINFHTSLGLTALILGLIYLPLRNLVSSRYFSRGDPDAYDLFRAATEIAFQPTAQAREQRWTAALERMFEPLSIERLDEGAVGPMVEREGLSLVIPAKHWSPALRLHHHRKGRKLFGEPHLATVDRLTQFVREADEGRQSYDRGVREERRRIGRDLHDNVGAMLLSSLRAPDGSRSRDMVRSALGDIREIVNGLSDRTETLANVVAQLRSETAERLSGIEFSWPEAEADRHTASLPYPVYRNFTSSHREIISNILKHSAARSVRVSTTLEGDTLVHRVENDLREQDADLEAGGGNGIGNLKQRAEELGGSFHFDARLDRAVAEMRLPLDRRTSA